VNGIAMPKVVPVLVEFTPSLAFIELTIVLRFDKLSPVETYSRPYVRKVGCLNILVSSSLFNYLPLSITSTTRNEPYSSSLNKLIYSFS
jgi:hypothetical protein